MLRRRRCLLLLLYIYFILFFGVYPVRHMSNVPFLRLQGSCGLIKSAGTRFNDILLCVYI